jgi:hypothetical protein
MKILYKITTILFMVYWGLALQAQTEPSLKPDRQSILIGEQINLEIGFTCPPGHSVFWPGFSDTLTSQFEIIRKTGLDSTLSSDQSSRYYFQKLTITSFDSGFLVIPPISIGYRIPGDTTLYFAETGAELIEVQTIPVDLEAAFKDIKNPMTAPFTFREALPYILGILVVLLLAFGALYLWRNRKKGEPIPETIIRPRVPAYQIALDALESLRLKKLWQKGHIKEYHTELTDIVREYLMLRFNIHAHELTSEEIMGAIIQTSVNGQTREKLRQILNLADMVKFARFQPLPAEHDNTLRMAVDFVMETRQVGDEITVKSLKDIMAEENELSDKTGQGNDAETVVNKRTEGDHHVE